MTRRSHRRRRSREREPETGSQRASGEGPASCEAPASWIDEAMELLRERGTTEIVKLLADEDPRVQFKAADALVLLGDLHEASALLWMVQKGPERGRVMAAHVLGRLRDPAAMLALLAAAEDPSSLVREAAERALKAIFGSTET